METTWNKYMSRKNEWSNYKKRRLEMEVREKQSTI